MYVCFFDMNPDKPSLLLENDFSDFKTLPSCKKDKRYNLQARLSSYSYMYVYRRWYIEIGPHYYYCGVVCS